MFKVIDAMGCIHDAYGTFLDEDGDIQFILCDNSGKFYKTEHIEGSFRLYIEDIKEYF
jgi:hypothetical protein